MIKKVNSLEEISYRKAQIVIELSYTKKRIDSTIDSFKNYGFISSMLWGYSLFKHKKSSDHENSVIHQIINKIKSFFSKHKKVNN